MNGIDALSGPVPRQQDVLHDEAGRGSVVHFLADRCELEALESR